MDKQEKVAREVFARYGYDFKLAKKTGGWTNAVWINQDVVVRVSGEIGTSRIKRELYLSKFFPDIIGYPQIIATGIIEELEWSLAKRIYADTLSEIWSSLAWIEKKAIILELITMANVIHSIDVNKVNAFTLDRIWYSSLKQHVVDKQLAFYNSKKIFTEQQMNFFCRLFSRFWNKHHKVEKVLVHGDITTDNILCYEKGVVSLLDFKHSAILPIEVDIHSIIDLALFNQNYDNSEECKNYKSTVLHHIRQMLNDANDSDILLAYATLYRMYFLDMWFKEPECKLDEFWAYKELKMIANGASFPDDLID